MKCKCAPAEELRDASAAGVFRGTGPLASIQDVKERSESVAGRIQFEVGDAQGGNDAVAAPLGGAEADEDHLVFGVVDKGRQFGFQRGLFRRVEVALENRELEVVAVVFAGFEHAAQAFGIGDVVANKVRGAHGGAGGAVSGS